MQMNSQMKRCMQEDQKCPKQLLTLWGWRASPLWHVDLFNTLEAL